MKIAIGADHAGIEYKTKLTDYLIENGYEVLNLGTDTTDDVDYPIYADKVCKAIHNNDAELGILICGTGIGMSIAANKHKGIRASVCTNAKMAELTRQHNDANVLCMGERIMDYETVLECADIFLKTEFIGGKHQARVEILNALD